MYRFNNLSMKVKLGLLAGIVFLGLIVLGGFALWQMQSINQVTQDNLSRIERINEAVLQVEQAHMHFRTQIQEWKNILIRGNDPQLFDRHLNSFNREADLTQTRLQQAMEQFTALGIDTTELQRLRQIHTDLGTTYLRALESFDANDPDTGQQIDTAVRGVDRAASQGLEQYTAEVQQQLDQIFAEVETIISDQFIATRTFLSIAVVVIILICAPLFWLIFQGIVRPLRALLTHFDAIGAGDYQQDIQQDRKDEIGMALKGLADMQTKLDADITETKRLASENLRIRYALDSVSASVMIADTQHDIIYVNDVGMKLFRRRMNEIRRDLPSFDSESLQGGNIDLFHKNPAHQRSMLESLRGAHRTQIKIGGVTLQLVASPIFDASGERLGSVIEWTDRTEELKVEQEVTALVEGAVQGDLSRRVVTDGLDGFFLRLGTGINGMVEQLQQLIGQITESVDAINTGAREIAVGNSDLSQRTEEQASSLEETASSMEELTSTVKQNADNARQANQLANTARDVAAQGGGKIEQAVQAMKDITRSSEKISDIITVIDGIAFQTNILERNPVNHRNDVAECGGRSGACWRARAGVCGGSGRSAQSGAAFSGGGQRDQRADC